MDALFDIIFQEQQLFLLVLICFFLSFSITFFGIPSIVRVSNLKNLTAMPNKRTSHIKPVPNLGGLAIFTSVILSTILIAGSFFGPELIYILAGLVIIFVTGIKDDILILDPKKKFAAQVITAVIIVILGDIRLTSFHGFLGINEISYLTSFAVSVFLYVLIINGFNLVDGIDGLASGIGILTSVVFGFWFWSSSEAGLTIFCFALAGSLIAFFRYNISSNKNKIFLGDTGSQIIGLIIAVLTISFLKLNITAEDGIKIESAPAFAFGVLILPMFDTLRVFHLRIKQGKSPFKADKQHIHHLLLLFGITHANATFILLTLNSLVILICYFMQQIGNLPLMLLMVVLSAVIIKLAVMHYRRRVKKVLDAEYHTFSKIKSMINEKNHISKSGIDYQYLKFTVKN